MDMRVEAAGGEDLAFASDSLGRRANGDRNARLGVGIASLADGGDPAVAQADVGFVDAAVVDDQRIGDDGVDRTLGASCLRLAHAIADHLAATELHLLAIDGEIALYLDEQFGVGEANLVARRRAIHVSIGGTGDAGGHFGS